MDYLFIYILITTVLSLGILSCNYIKNSLYFRKLGSPLYMMDRALQWNGFSKYIIRVLSILLIAIYVIYSYHKSFNMLTLFFIVLLSVTIGQFSFPLTIYNSKFGLYQNGAVTTNGVILFSNIKKYDIQKDADRVKIILHSKYDFFGGGSILYTDRKHSLEIMKFLNKRMKCQ